MFKMFASEQEWNFTLWLELKAKLTLSIFTKLVRAQARPSPSVQSGGGRKNHTLN